MTTKLVTVEPQNSVATAIRLMREGDLRRLPVLENGALVGILTSGDLRRITGLSSILRDRSQDNFLWYHIPVANVMTRDPITLPPDAPISQAANILIDYKIGGLPIIDGGKILGIITSSDLLQWLIRLEERAEAPVMA